MQGGLCAPDVHADDGRAALVASVGALLASPHGARFSAFARVVCAGDLGLGAVASRDAPAGVAVLEYCGVLSTDAELASDEELRGAKSKYAFRLAGWGAGAGSSAAAHVLVLDGALRGAAPARRAPAGAATSAAAGRSSGDPPLPCAAGRINDPRPDGEANTRFVEVLCGGVPGCCGPPGMLHAHVVVATTRDVKAGDALLLPYGRDFRLDGDGEGDAARLCSQAAPAAAAAPPPPFPDDLCEIADRLHDACAEGRFADAKEALEEAPDEADVAALLAHHLTTGKTPLMEAALATSREAAKLVKHLLEKGSDTEARPAAAAAGWAAPRVRSGRAAA